MSEAWAVTETDRAIAERHQASRDIVDSHGKEFAQKWLAGLIAAIRGLGEIPGPRAWRRSEAEGERRRMEVRVRIYGGPGRKPSRAVSYCIVYSVHDPAPGETEGLVQILRVVHVATEEAARFGADAL